jgi:hypothetical protein
MHERPAVALSGGSMMRRFLWTLTFLTAAAAPGYAQTHAGVRAGVSGDPNQFIFGGHVETKEIAERLTFRPNVEIGLGDGLTVVALNIEFAYWLPTRTEPWRVYVGGGPAANIVHLNGVGGLSGSTSTGGGFNVLLGAQHKGGLFTELKLGVADSPGVKFTVGYQLR